MVCCPSLGDGLAANLCSAASATVAPSEDVKSYLEAVLLPALGPATEQLLRHVHETGELRRALREQRDSERQDKRLQEESKSVEQESPSPRSQSGSPSHASMVKEDG